MRPQEGDYNPYYENYINEVPGTHILDAFAIIEGPMFRYLDAIAEDRGEHAYASGKWTIKQVVQHMIDTERIFAYRALSFSRGETLPLPGFEENAYAAFGTASHRTVADLVDEFKLVRASTVALLRSFTADDFGRIGIASSNKMTVLAAGYVIAGHALHHINVLKERYLIHSIA